MIGILSIPVQCLGDGALGNFNSNGVATIGFHLGVHHKSVVDRDKSCHDKVFAGHGLTSSSSHSERFVCSCNLKLETSKYPVRLLTLELGSVGVSKDFATHFCDRIGQSSAILGERGQEG